MIGFILRLAMFSLGFYALSQYLIPDIFTITGGYTGYGVTAFVFAFINAFIKPVVEILSLPFRLISLGLFSFIINGFLIYLVQQALEIVEIQGVTMMVEGYLAYIIVGFVMSVVSWFVHLVD